MKSESFTSTNEGKVYQSSSSLHGWWRLLHSIRGLHINDFLAPATSCIKPANTVGKKPNKASARIQVGADGAVVEVDDSGHTHALKKVEISLTDCLACSGCVTTSETILITSQSTDELLKILTENKKAANENRHEDLKYVVVSISPQTVISFATKYSLSADEAASRLAGFFVELGASRVLSTAVFQSLSLLESANEFVTRWRARQSNTSSLLPVLTSECPGSVCLFEKKYGAFILPYVSGVRSGQQVMGPAVKDVVCEQQHLPYSQVYSVAVMPCFDKKLEGARPDFFSEERQSREVDLVVSSGEVERLLHDMNLELRSIHPAPESVCRLFPDSVSHCHSVVSYGGDGSGGYLDFVFRYASKVLFGVDVTGPLTYSPVKNKKDLNEVVLEIDGKVQLRFLASNGMKNLLLVAQQIKNGRSAYDYVQVMACPSGCLNGGGQLQPADTLGGSEEKQQFLQAVVDLYQSLPVTHPLVHPDALKLYHHWLKATVDGPAESKPMLYTQYHKIEPTDFGVSTSW